MADFRAIVSVLPCSLTNKGKKNLLGCVERLIDNEPSWLFDCPVCQHKNSGCVCNFIGAKKGRTLLISTESYCFDSLRLGYSFEAAEVP